MTRTRSSAALTALAVLAIVFALVGTNMASYAAGKAKGDSIIKKHSLSGNRLKSDSVGGAEINEASMGTVPRAALADTLPTPAFVDLVLGAGWAEIAAQTRQVGYRKDAGGVVHLQGAVQRTSGSSDVIGIIPPGFRPSGTAYFLAFSNGGSTAGVSMGPDGALRYFGGGLDSFISLEGITYVADQ